jgi:MOSC domain-containing protein YiiM
MNKSARIFGVFAGGPKTITDEHGTWASSIWRQPVVGGVAVCKEGLAGDKATQPYHGGLDAAVCVHLTDHYRFWRDRYGMQLEPGAVGENFTLENAEESDICIGDIVRVGTTLLQVSGPRVPCGNQARRIGRNDWAKLTVRENRTGFYTRVLEEGSVQSGDLWQVQERLNDDGSITAINRCMYLEFDPEFARRVAQMPGLAAWWKEQLKQRKEQIAHWSTEMKR